MIKKHPIELIFATVFIALSIVLNLQFLEGSNINHTIAGHDEYIAVKEVYSILHPVSFKHFIMAVISGNALYYGRIMFYLDALFAFLPFKIWGVTGMVFTIRMVHAGFLLAALLVLSNSFLNSTLQKALFYTGIFCLYYTMYFIMMPKPEPHQLFFLALFLNRFKHSGWTFGRHFFWMGIAYGLKFNMLLLLPLVFTIPLIKKGGIQWMSDFASGLKSLGFLMGGILAAIPCLVLTPLRPVFLQTYLHETFGGTVKSYDDAALTANDWLLSGLGGSYLGHWIWAYPFIILVLAALFLSVRRAVSTRDFSIPVLLISGLMLTIVIIFNTKRLWPHYLWTGYVLMLLGLIAATDVQKQMKGRRISVYLLFLCTGSSVFFYLKRELPMYLGLSAKPDIRQTIALSHKAIDYLRYRYPGKRIGTDASLLYPFKDYVQVDVYHPFSGRAPETVETRFDWYGDAPQNIWEDSNAAVVFYDRHPEKILKENMNVYAGRHDTLFAIYRNRIQSDFEHDTAFEGVHIFRRK